MLYSDVMVILRTIFFEMLAGLKPAFVRMPPACATLSECRGMGMCRRQATFGNLRAYAVFFIAEDEQGGVCRRVVKASRLPSPNAAPW